MTNETKCRPGRLMPSALLACAFIAAIGAADSQQLHAPLPGARLSTPGHPSSAITNGAAVRSSNVSAGTTTWLPLGTVSSHQVTQGSIAGDGTRLFVFYREPHPELNEDFGILKEWDGSAWTGGTTPTLECHDPDVAVKGSLVVAGWETDGTDHGFCSNVNGPWVSLTGSILVFQFGTRVAIAQNRGYVAYAARYSDGSPFSYMMLHVDSPLGPGTSAELDGGWTVTNTDVGTDPSIAGDGNGWVALFKQSGWLYAKRGSVSGSSSSITDVGTGFRMTVPPGESRIVIRAGIPTALWLEDTSKTLYVAEWGGSQWTLIGQASTQAGTFRSICGASIDSTLYVAYDAYGESPRIIVSSWNGSVWSGVDGTLESNSQSSIATVRVAVYQGKPVVAFVENDTLKVLTSSSTTGIDKGTRQTTFALFQNYPNPFNPSTAINYELPAASSVTLKIADLLGREVAVLVDGVAQPGRHEVHWDARGRASGVYFCRLTSGMNTKTIKLLLTR